MQAGDRTPPPPPAREPVAPGAPAKNRTSMTMAYGTPRKKAKLTLWPVAEMRQVVDDLVHAISELATTAWKPASPLAVEQCNDGRLVFMVNTLTDGARVLQLLGGMDLPESVQWQVLCAQDAPGGRLTTTQVPSADMMKTLAEWQCGLSVSRDCKKPLGRVQTLVAMVVELALGVVSGQAEGGVLSLLRRSISWHMIETAEYLPIASAVFAVDCSEMGKHADAAALLPALSKVLRGVMPACQVHLV